ncbi:MAG: tRNA-binding protein [Flavobacteriales bacterium]
MEKISWDDFTRVEIRVGTVISAELNAGASKPAFKLSIDFGQELGILKSSAQITDYYTIESLVGSQIMAVVNFPEKQIGKSISQCLVLGVHDEKGAVILMRPEFKAPNGSRML